jgi:hypothetical protein
MSAISQPGRWDSRPYLPRFGVSSHDQGFDRPAPVTQISVYLEVDMNGVGHALCKSGFRAAYWARVSGLRLE